MPAIRKETRFIDQLQVLPGKHVPAQLFRKTEKLMESPEVC